RASLARRRRTLTAPCAMRDARCAMRLRRRVPRKLVVDSALRDRVVVPRDLGRATNATRANARDGSRAQSAERLPNHVTRVRRSANDPIEKLERFLVRVKRARAASLDPLVAAHRGLTPNVRDPDLAMKLRAKRRPLLRAQRSFSVGREVRST